MPPPSPPPELVEPIDEVNGGSPSHSIDPPRAVATTSDGDEAEPGKLEGLLVGTKWGVFTLTPIQPRTLAAGKKSTAFGGYQVACPFRRLNEKSGCKRTFSMKESTHTATIQCLREALYWCGTYHL